MRRTSAPRQMIRILDSADYTSMPWRNGSGRTTEIAVHPPGAALDAFAWRVSIADVASDGPFSRFPGVDRTIVLVEGAGMRLHSQHRDVELRTPFAQHAFSGDDAVDCTLIAGPVRDFNAMLRRGAARGSVTVVRGGRAEVAQEDFTLAYAAIGMLECVVPGHPPRILGAGQAMLAEGSARAGAPPIAIGRSGVDFVALVVSIQCT